MTAPVKNCVSPKAGVQVEKRRTCASAILWCAVTLAVFVSSLFAVGCRNAIGSAGSILQIGEASRLARAHSETGVTARVRGVVTFSDLESGDCFIQDASGGLRILLRKNQVDLGVGDEVEASGLIRVNGPFALLIEPSIVLVGRKVVPLARSISVEKDDLSGFINQLVSFRGTVESSVQYRAGVQRIVVRSGQLRAILRASRMPEVDAEKFPGNEFEVSGVLVRIGNPSDIPHEIQVWSADVRSLHLSKRAPLPDTLPVLTVANLTRLSLHKIPEERVRVQGVLATSSAILRIRDFSGDIAVKLKFAAENLSGASADLTGFVNYENGELVLANAEPVVSQKANREEIQTALAVHHMPLQSAALRVPVRLNAVVTFYKHNLGLLFVQDGTDAIFVESQSPRPLPIRAGDRVEITGATVPGEFAPNVGNSAIHVVGTSTMPDPERDIETIFSGQMDCRWVELNGVVQEVSVERGASLVALVWGNHAFKAHVDAPYEKVRSLVDQHVVMRGAIGTVFNNRRQVLGVQLYVPGLQFVRLIGAVPVEVSSTPARSVDSLMQFSPDTNIGHRVRVQGIVTLASASGPTWLRDSTGGLLISSHNPAALQVGDLVDVFGFPESGGFGPAMSSAWLMKIRSGLPVPPILITPEDPLGGSAESQLVRIDGTVVNASVERMDIVTTLRSGPYLFVVRLPLTQSGATDIVSNLRPGAQIRATGICSVIVDHHRYWVVPRGFEILMRSPDDLVILKNASWFTLGHVAEILSGTLVLIILGIGWISMLRRNVRRQTSNLTVKTRELEEANQIANEAVRSARKAENLEQDRKMVLEMVAKDEGLEGIMEVMARMVARHLPETICFIQLDLPKRVRISTSSSMPDLKEQVFFLTAAASALDTSTTLPEDLAGGVGCGAGEELSHRKYLAVPISRGSQRVGAVVALWEADCRIDTEQLKLLESWGRFAGLAVERRNLYEELSHRARFDNLTSLYNRASLYEHLEVELTSGATTSRMTGILFLDLDNFKQINDGFGHDAGDFVLQEIARRIQLNIRQADLAARVGGDEFVVVLPGLHNRAEAEDIASVLIREICEPIMIEGREVRVGASHGISTSPDEGVDLESLLKAADDGMYRTKSRRKRSERMAQPSVGDAVLIA